jgi:type II secretory pathway component PulJ
MTTRRLGKSLIEMVVVIGLLGSLLVTTGTTMHTVVFAEAGARRANDRLTAVSRSAIAFRRDVHAAAQTTVAEDGRKFTCQTADGEQIEYVVAADTLTRSQTDAAMKSEREAYRLYGATVQFRSDMRSGRAVLVMAWQLPPTTMRPGQATDLVPIPVEAVPRLVVAER